MSGARPPLLEPRGVDALVRAAEARLPAYVPGWRPAPRGTGAAVVQAYARFLKALADRVNQAPDKNELAFLDMLGVELLAAQAARVPVVFKALAAVGDSRIPDRSRVGAKVEGRSEPVVFETDEPIALAAAGIAQLFTLWPGRDAFADHTAAAQAGEPFTLFEPLEPVRHEMYLAHDVLLALAGRSTVELCVELATAGGAPLPVTWEYWDGGVWRGFKEFRPSAAATAQDSVDGTDGLTRSGVIRLVADCATTRPTTVDGVTALWLRGRLAAPLPPTAADELPEVERVLLRTIVDRGLPAGACAALADAAGILPEQAFAGETKLDLTKSVQPLGAHPAAGDALYLSCAEAFAKPGAEVTLCFRRVKTPEEIADQGGASFEAGAAAAAAVVVKGAVNAAEALLAAAETVRQLATSVPATFNPRVNDVTTALNALKSNGMDELPNLHKAAKDLVALFGPITAGLVKGPASVFWDFTTVTDLSKMDFLSDSLDFVAFRDHNQKRIVDAAAKARQASGEIRDALDQLRQLAPATAAAAAGAKVPTMDAPVVAWEYWNGRRWAPLAVQGGNAAATFRGDGPVSFVVPDDMEPLERAGVTALWARARLVSGGYGVVRMVAWKESGHVNFMPIVQVHPPTVDKVQLGYVYRSPEAFPEHCRALNDFRFEDRDEDARTAGTPFRPFAPVDDRTPTLYLGFDRPLPADRIGLFADVEEVAGETQGPALAWEHWDGGAWLPLRVREETRALALPGMIAALWPGEPPPPPVGTPPDTRLARFGTPLVWMRARLASDRPPRRARLLGIYLNAVWASQLQTYENEVIGSGNGEPDQVFFVRNVPVLAGEVVEVRELAGDRARVEELIMREELARSGVPESDVRTVRDARTGSVSEVWVRWRPRSNLLFSPPGARHYVVERSRGRILFGGRTSGLAPSAGRDNVRVRSYRAGGGVAGNVARGAVSQILAGVLAERVTNPRRAEGGAEGESIERVLQRGPAVVRHRRQAIAPADYESLALDASPAVAVARALPATHPSGRREPGWVTVQIVPFSDDPRPTPSFELRERVRRFLAERAPATAAARVSVVAAPFFPVGVDATVSPVDPSNAGPVVGAVAAALARFLHPLTGGPEGTGWPFGRDIYLSDVAALVESVDGVDYAETIALLADGTPAGERVAVPDDRIAVAGAVRLTLPGREG